jgi:hypothetical protein
MLVVTIDQVGSSTSRDRVPAFLEALDALTRGRCELAFERTVGDEVQGVLSEPAALRAVVSHALRDGHWSIGVGIGAVDLPLPSSTREAAGPAFVLARRAVERAKGKRMLARVAVEAADPRPAADLEAAWHLVATIAAERSPKMWEAIDTVSAMNSNSAAAAHLGISVQALSERLRRAGWAAEVNARPLLDDLAGRADA